MSNDSRNSQKPPLVQALPSLIVAGAVVAGSLGLLLTVYCTFAGDRMSGGLFLIASSLAFGLLINAILRD